MENICSDLFLPECELTEVGNDRIFKNYQGWEISNVLVGTMVGRLGVGRMLQLLCKNKNI